MSNSAGFEQGAATSAAVVFGIEHGPDIVSRPTTQQDILKTVISELSEGDVAKRLGEKDGSGDEAEGLIDEGLANDIDDGDEDSRGECSQDDDEPQQDNAYEDSSALDSGEEDSIDAEDRWPIRVYKVEDAAGNIQHRCFVNKCAVGHERNYLSDAIAVRDRIVVAVAKWLEGNRQKFLSSFNIDNLGGDSDKQAFMEAAETLKEGSGKCPVMQKGLLGRIGEKVDEDGQEDKFTRYLKVLCLRSDELGKDIDLRILFSREAKFAWAAAAIRGYIKDQTKCRRSNREYLQGSLIEPVKAIKFAKYDAWKDMKEDEFVEHVIRNMDVNEFIPRVIRLLKISYEDIEGRITNDKVER